MDMVQSEGYEKAVDLLLQACSPSGFLASPREKDNYKRVWTRDGVVTGLASLLTGNRMLEETFRNTLITIFEHQHCLGFMPSSVTSGGLVSYGGTVGRADNPSWAVIGLCAFALRTNDAAFAKRYTHAVERCFHVLDVWEYNGKHLVYVPQSGDWADEYLYHGYLLFDQLLRLWALRLASTVFQREEWKRKSEEISSVILNNYWNDGIKKNRYAPNLAHQLADAPKDFWFMGFNPARIYHQFDLQANALALLLFPGEIDRHPMLIRYIKNLMIKYNSTLPAFYPAVQNSDWQMQELRNNHAYGFRNYPNQFHNGGLWPVWNGFMVSALAQYGEQEAARHITHGIHTMNAIENWSFNECHDGETKLPNGVSYCTWSAAGVIIAENALNANYMTLQS